MALRTAVVLLIMLLALPGQSANARSVVMLDVQGPIGPAMADFVTRGITGSGDAAAIILRLNTPGGLDSSMREINSAILKSEVPVICWVAPAGARAASAGTYILYACHMSAMAPGTNLGAATPVNMGGEMDEAMKAKVVNDAAAYLRSLALLRGRNAEWADQSVRKGASLAAGDAVAHGVVDLLAADLDTLLAGAEGREVAIGDDKRPLHVQGLAVRRLEPDLRTRVLAALGSPEIAYILMLVGIYGIIFEMMSPGAVAPGVIGGISLLLGLYALNLLPVNYAGVGLLLLGLGLLVAEAFLPSFGILGLGGVLAFAFGSLMMFDTGVPGFELSLTLVVVATGTMATALLGGLFFALHARKSRSVAGSEALIGACAVVDQWQETSGLVHLMGENWNARANQPVSRGDTVRIVAREGLVLTVEPTDETKQGRP